MKKLYLFALAAMVFAACATDETQDLQPVDAPESLTVGFEGGDDDTRVQLNSAGKTVWTKGDLVSVFYRSNANQKWQFQGKTGERTGLLKRVSTPEATMQLSDVVVAYPYSEEYYINPKTCNIQAYLPATQSYLKDSFGLDGNLMVSAGEYNQIYLKNVCGWLKLQLTGEGEMVQSITLKGNNGEQVAGSIYVDTETATATLAAETNGGYEDGVGGTLVFDDAILTEVALNCGNGVELGAEPTAFYIALPPQMFEKGITVEIADTSGYTMTQSTDKSLAIERNTIQPMATFKFINPNTPTQPTPANNEIWYTATAKVEPYYPDEFGATITSNVWDSESGKGVITFNANVTKIGYYAFSECKKLKTITIPDSVSSIGPDAFYKCTSLTSINIPDSVTSIGDYAFYNCSSLTSATIGNSVTSIGQKAFENCTSLTSINIPDSVTSIGDYAFYNCSSLTNVTIPDSVTSIGKSAFYLCDSLTSITIPDSVTSIGDSAFSSCKSLTTFYGKFTSEDNRCLIVNGRLISFAIGCGATSYIIPNSVTSIGEGAFWNCTSLTSVTIGNGVTSIGDSAFSDCTSLTSITIPNSVTSIGSGAFIYCSSLTSITIPNSVTSIGAGAFIYCSSLKTVYCKRTTPPTGDSNMFLYNASGRRIFVPASDDDSIINAYKAKNYWSSYKSYIFEYDFSAQQ